MAMKPTAVSGLLAAGVVALLLSLPLRADSPTPLALGYRPLPYPAPVPGSYILPVLGLAADGDVLDTTGQPLALHSLLGDRLVLLSFIYSTCDDINGCPLATAVLHRLAAAIKATPGLEPSLRLITLSFNPVHDTPAEMARFGRSLQTGGVDWRFLTTRSSAEIDPILRAYQQPIEREVNPAGQQTGRFSHLLRVFLIDRDRQIRNIYSASVLHPDLVMADIKTLRMAPATTVRPAAKAASATVTPQRAGDDKSGYADAGYQTRSAALQQRTGRAADLLAQARRPVLGLPVLSQPPSNPLSREKIQLGRKLFFDRRLSLNATFSCAMCHIPEQGFTSQEQATAIGIEGRTVRRNAPTLYNVAYLQSLFHDSRESSLENQVWGPLLAHNEMANPSVGFVIDKLRTLPDYRGLFERAFGRGPGMDTVGQALASYERVLVAGDSAFDRWHYGGQADALPPAAQAGYALFTGKAGCSACHTIEPKYALFTDQRLHNTGLGYRRSMAGTPHAIPVQVAPGIQLALDAASIAQVAGPRPDDLGRYEISQRPEDRWRYRTPTLRNIALTAPYMHDGSLPDLPAVVAFYNRGGEPNEWLDPLIRPLGLNDSEAGELVAFLASLTGRSVDILVSDAWSAPVGDR